MLPRRRAPSNDNNLMGSVRSAQRVSALPIPRGDLHAGESRREKKREKECVRKREGYELPMGGGVRGGRDARWQSWARRKGGIATAHWRNG